MGQIDNDVDHVDGTNRQDISLSRSDRSDRQIKQIMIYQIVRTDRADRSLSRSDKSDRQIKIYIRFIEQIDQKDHDLNHMYQTDNS